MTDRRTIKSPGAHLRDRVAELEVITGMYRDLLLEVFGAEDAPRDSECLGDRIRSALTIADYILSDTEAQP